MLVFLGTVLETDWEGLLGQCRPKTVLQLQTRGHIGKESAAGVFVDVRCESYENVYSELSNASALEQTQEVIAAKPLDLGHHHHTRKWPPTPSASGCGIGSLNQLQKLVFAWECLNLTPPILCDTRKYVRHSCILRVLRIRHSPHESMESIE